MKRLLMLSLLPLIAHAGGDNIIRVKAPVTQVAQTVTPAPDPEPTPEPEVVVLSSCSKVLANSPGSPSGVYNITLNGRDVPVYCDMTTDGGGWTLVARGFPNSVGAWSTSTGAINSGSTPTVSTSFSFKLADSDINAIEKTAYKVATTTGYINTRYFKGSCVYAHTTRPEGDCAISYANLNWTGARGNGLASDRLGGLTDHRSSVANDGYFVATAAVVNTTTGWAAGNGTTSNMTGGGGAGDRVTMNIFVR